MNLGAPRSTAAALTAEGLTRRFGERLAVGRMDFTISHGEVFGPLGRNGAGKSTTVCMLTGHLAPTAGRGRVEGIDVAVEPCRARRHIGVVPEEANVYAAELVMRSITRTLETTLKLKVDPAKSKVAPMSECNFLGFTIRGNKIRWTDKVLAHLKRRVKELTGRSWGPSQDSNSPEDCFCLARGRASGPARPARVSMEYRLHKLGQPPVLAMARWAWSSRQAGQRGEAASKCAPEPRQRG